MFSWDTYLMLSLIYIFSKLLLAHRMLLNFRLLHNIFNVVQVLCLNLVFMFTWIYQHNLNQNNSLLYHVILFKCYCYKVNKQASPWTKLIPSPQKSLNLWVLKPWKLNSCLQFPTLSKYWCQTVKCCDNFRHVGIQEKSTFSIKSMFHLRLKQSHTWINLFGTAG